MKYVIIDERIPKEAADTLISLGFRIFKLPRQRNLPLPIASHTDIAMARVGKRIFTSRAYREENPELFSEMEENLPFEFIYTDEAPMGEYPLHAIFNCLVIGGKAFARTDALSPSLAEHLQCEGYDIIKVKQGYPACTVLPLSGSLAITSDRGMARALGSSGISVKLISDSSAIALPPYPFGFIGGSGAVLGDTVYFFGNLSSHPDSEAIAAAIADSGKKFVSLMPKSDRLFDLGGAIFYDKDVNED